jgi:hypothetical protein
LASARPAPKVFCAARSLKARLIAAPLAVALAGCSTNNGGPPQSALTGAERTPVTAGQAEWFVDRAEAAGLDFVHVNGATGRFYQPEISGSGAALFDYDNDGDLDVWLVQGGSVEPGPPQHRTAGVGEGGRLFRNDLEVRPDGTRTLRFTDVTETSRLVTRGYGQGVAAGDIDNDGWIDLYLTGFRRNQMFRNNRDGTFSDVSKGSGTDSPGTWGVSAAFVDVDRDGWLDLFVGNYLTYSVETHVRCVMESGLEDYCAPGRYTPERDRFYRNRGDGTFADATAKAGMDRGFGPALGVSTSDFNGDGWTDIFVANDQRENQLWINRGNGTFENRALVSGVALDGAGVAKADMGVDAGDFDNDGDEDLITTVLTREGNTLYVNDGKGQFEDRSVASGIAVASRPYTGWGVAWMDFDNDGWLDLLAVNGLVKLDLNVLSAENPWPYQQRNQLLRNLGTGRFEDVTGRAGAALALKEVSRGAAFGDIDNDGDTDVLVANSGGSARLLINGIGSRNHWIGLRLVGANTTPRDMLGARVAIVRPDGPTLWRRARADGSYASANDPRVLVGLGASASAPRVRVIWPSGRTEEWNDVPVDRYTTLVEGGSR